MSKNVHKSNFATHVAAMFTDGEWHADPYKIAGFLCVALFIAVTAKVWMLVDEKATTASIGAMAALLVPITTMATFLFNYAKQNDATLYSKRPSEQPHAESKDM